jgi:hypothetical protein
MSKRRANQHTKASASQKKQRTQAFGAANASDADLLAPQNIPSSSSISSRKLQWAIPSLLSTAINVFSQHLDTIYEQQPTQTQRALKHLPDGLSTKLLTALRRDKPTFLSHGFLVAVSNPASRAFPLFNILF